MRKTFSNFIPVILSLVLVLSSVALSLAWPVGTTVGQAVATATATPGMVFLGQPGSVQSEQSKAPTAGAPHKIYVSGSDNTVASGALAPATKTPMPTRWVLPSNLATTSPNAEPAAISPHKYEDDLSIWLTVDDYNVYVGEIVTFKLTIENEGDYRVKRVRISLPLTDGLKIMSAKITDDGNTDFDRSGGDVRASLKRLDAGDTVTLTVRAMITRKAYDEELSGRAKVSWDGGYQTSNRWRLRLRNR